MEINKRIKNALRIAEGIKGGKIDSKNLYDLLLHLSEVNMELDKKSEFMEAKEKATELTARLLDDSYLGLILEEAEAKKCALICVRELKTNIPECHKTYKYWTEVEKYLLE